MNPIQMAHQLGQSIWFDNIQRRLLENGFLSSLIEKQEILGITSNPSIFQKAIAETADYDDAIQPMAISGLTEEEIFIQLALEDIRAACDLFSGVYEKTEKVDGYVSLEVNPLMAHDAERTFHEAKRLWGLVDRPNLMVKIPGTKEGIPAIQKAIAAGLNINVTLIFSINRYLEVMDAYISGLEERIRLGLPIESIASVASFFVSRVDTMVDKIIEDQLIKRQITPATVQKLIGKSALANSRLAYFEFLKVFQSSRFLALKEAGARYQRPLWASTSTKNQDYSDVMYVEGLVAPESVNTVPPKTLDAFRDHGIVKESILETEVQSRQIIHSLQVQGIDMDAITGELEKEGVKAFADSYIALLASIQKRSLSYKNQLGILQSSLVKLLPEFKKNNIVQRLWDRDPSLWGGDPTQQAEIKNRLGWLQLPFTWQNQLQDIQEFLAGCRTEGFEHALLLGMGGSSLAPEVFSSISDDRNTNTRRGINFQILDTTDPEEIAAAIEKIDLRKTLFIVSSKSGTTVETLALFNFFWDLISHQVGITAGNQFVAITDPGTVLAQIAQDKQFRRTFLADPNVGGRFSALSIFGILPAALMGYDLSALMLGANRLATFCSPETPVARNPGLVLGAALFEALRYGKDKLTILSDPPFEMIGAWLEQLIAESCGKSGEGIIPIVQEVQGGLKYIRNDRFFIYLKNNGKLASYAEKLLRRGHPVMVFNLKDSIDLTAHFFLWEIAVAITCSLMGINAFDQPDVEYSKKRTRSILENLEKTGRLTDVLPIWQSAQADVLGTSLLDVKECHTVSDIIHHFVMSARSDGYVAINAFLPRNTDTIRMLQQVRNIIHRKTGLATTLGFGPRFLHSTGQLHKGGPSNGIFIVLTRQIVNDLKIPGGLTFGQLQFSQASGDTAVLLDRNRKAIHIHFKQDYLDSLSGLLHNI